jgi:hypothetical protein
VQESSWPANCSSDSAPAQLSSGAWGHWWVRALLFVFHLALLVEAASLTPEDYFVRLGAAAGGLILIGTPFLWFLLWFARTRMLVLLFCGFVLGQTGITALVALTFRAEAEVMQQVSTEGAQRQKEAAAQIADLHLDRVFKMLKPENGLHPEDLPDLQARARFAQVKLRELQATHETWLKDAEKRIAAVNTRAAINFRRGVESSRERSEQIQKVTQDYYTGIDRLVTLLIDRQGSYRITSSGLMFNRGQDADMFNQILDSLKAMEERINAEGQRQSELMNDDKKAADPSR